MNLRNLTEASMERLKDFKNAHGETIHTEPNGSDWSLTDWFTALTGEVDEVGGIIKKIRRGDVTLEEAYFDLADELADVFCYLVILAERSGINLEYATVRKFNEVSRYIGSEIRVSTFYVRDGEILRRKP